jgi:hypothetical protein
MKKALIFILLIILSVPAFNQESEKVLLNKSGVNILPEKGDIAIGIDAVPFLNLLNNKGNSPGFNFINNLPSISLKYFNSNSSAFRMSVLLGFSSIKDNDDSADQFTKNANGSVGLRFGYEKRLGKSRVQGFYGAEGNLNYGKVKNTSSPDIVSFETTKYGAGASLFIGAEVFVATKLSVGGQFTWGPSYSIEKDIHNETTTSRFIVGADNAFGALILSFHF